MKKDDTIIIIEFPNGEKIKIEEPLSRRLVDEAKRLKVDVEDLLIAIVKSYLAFKEVIEKARRGKKNE